MSVGWLIAVIVIVVLGWAEGVRRTQLLYGKLHAWAILAFWAIAPHALAISNEATPTGIDIAHMLEAEHYVGEYLYALGGLVLVSGLMQLAGELAAAIQVAFK